MDTAHKYSFWDFKGEVEFIDKWFFMSTPVPVLTICLFYLAYVTKIGPKLMKNKPAYNLNNVLILYNVIQVFLSLAMASAGIKLLQGNGILLPRTCIQDDKKLMKNVATATYYYLLVKLSELLDTVFFVLRKKDRQITFLHVYHHTSMTLITWFILKYEPTYTTIFLGTLNSLVHVVMYSYYALSAVPGLSKHLWWKKYITSMQLVQFMMIVVQVLMNYQLSSCQTSYIMFTVIIINTVLFLCLFSDFYLKAYLKNRNRPHGAPKGLSDVAKSDEEKNNYNNNTVTNGNICKTKQI